MANNFSNFLELNLIGHTLLGSVYTSPATRYLSLATSIASDGDIYTEVTTNLGYARILLNGTLSAPTSLNDTTVVNSSNLTFSAATSPWGIVSHFAIFDAETIGSGNMLYHGDLTTTRDVQTDDVLEFQAGSFTIRLN